MNPIDPDGVVIEDQMGNRLIAVPTALLEVLRFAAVIQYTRQGYTYRMRVDGLGDKAPVLPAQPGPAPAAYNPSPTTPPAALVLLAPVETAGEWTCPNPECGVRTPLSRGACQWCNTPRPTW